MEIKELEYFKVVCEQKSITRAAKYLYISQQGLSKLIKNLENELQTTLLERTSSGIRLTETGQYLYERIPAFLGDYHSICSDIQEIEQRKNHEIELLSSYGIIRLVTPECLADFRQKYPHIHLTCHEYPDRVAERLFIQGQGNIGFFVANNDIHFPGAYDMERFEIKLLVHADHPYAKLDSVSIEDLREQKLYIESSEFNIHELILRRCRKAGFEPEIAFETSGFSLCHKMVQQNKGISVTVDFIFDDMAGKDLVMVPFRDEPLYWITSMAVREGSLPNHEVELFKAHVLSWQEKIKLGQIRR